MSTASRRKTLRTAVRSLLASALGPGVEVTDHLFAPITDLGQRRIVNVTTMDGARAQESGDETIQDDIDLVLVIYAAETDAERVEDRLDHLAEKIAEALMADTTLGGLVYDLVPGPQNYDFADEGDAQTGVLMDSWTVTLKYQAYTED